MVRRAPPHCLGSSDDNPLLWLLAAGVGRLSKALQQVSIALLQCQDSYGIPHVQLEVDGEILDLVREVSFACPPFPSVCTSFRGRPAHGPRRASTPDPTERNRAGP